MNRRGLIVAGLALSAFAPALAHAQEKGERKKGGGKGETTIH